MKVYVAPLRAVPLALFVLTKLSANDPELPDGKGKEAVVSNCTVCHTTERIQDKHLNEEGWNAIVREMIEAGASINPDDMKVIASYLANHFGPKVNVNEASASAIASALQLTQDEANAIVQYRLKNGNFKTISDVEKVPGLADKIDAKKAQIEF